MNEHSTQSYISLPLKDCTDDYVYQQLFMEMWDRYCDYIPVYMDGLQDGNYLAKHRKFRQLLKPWNKVKIPLHPNILFL